MAELLPPTTSQQAHFASASLYVGDLAPEVSETMLYEIFNAIGPVASIRVCREAGTRKSLGYAYVNYHSVEDAERSLDTLNYTTINGIPCRLMWSHRDPSIRKSGAGNIFVKNLDRIIDNKALYDTFSLFGNILSCKVAMDEYGKSRGYGFVHYETEEAAIEAMQKVNSMRIGSKNVFVGLFKKRVERVRRGDAPFTNLYVKQFPETWNDETVERVFAPFGTITSSVVTVDSKGRRFAFVNYESCDSALSAVESLHGKKTTSTGVDDLPDASDETTPEVLPPIVETVVSSECAAPLAAKAVDDDAVVSLPLSEATSSDVVKDVKDAKDEPTETANVLPDLRLYVQRAMSKSERTAMLKEVFSTTASEPSPVVVAPKLQQAVNLYIKNLDEAVDDEQLGEVFSKFGTVTSAKVMRDAAGVSKGFGFVCFAFSEDATKAITAMHLKIFHNKPLYVGLAERRDHRVARLQLRYRIAPNGRPELGGSQSNTFTPGANNPQWRQRNTPPYPTNYPNNNGGPSTAFKFTAQARNRQEPPPMGSFKPATPSMPGQPSANAAAPGSTSALSAQSLAAAHPQMQKQMLGERLFPLVAKYQPELAGKITGMMLEMDNAELLTLIECDVQLRAKVDEALGVLHRHQSGVAPMATRKNGAHNNSTAPTPVN